jgi:hypothetical protein
MLYDGSNTKLTLQAYGGATGANYGSKIIVNGGGTSGGNISFINDSTTTCVTNSSGLGIGKTNPNCRLYVSTNAGNNVNSFAIRVSIGLLPQAVPGSCASPHLESSPPGQGRWTRRRTCRGGPSRLSQTSGIRDGAPLHAPRGRGGDRAR